MHGRNSRKLRLKVSLPPFLFTSPSLLHSGPNKMPVAGAATYKGEEVLTTTVPLYPKSADGTAARTVTHKNFTASKKLLVILNQLRDVKHENINKFVGIAIVPQEDQLNAVLVSEYASKGSLHDLFESTTELDWQFRNSFMVDLLEGMKYIHRSVIVCHGYLTGWRCLIDKHFTLKISELAFKRIAEEMVQEQAKAATRAMFKEHTAFWTAPEILRGESEPNKTTDVYSVGVILFEIFTQSLPYEGVTLLTQEEIVTHICEGTLNPLKFRTKSDSAISPQFQSVLGSTWDQNPANRPTITRLRSGFDEASEGSSTYEKKHMSLMDKIISRLEIYAGELEHKVAERTTDLIAESAKCDQLLRQILPASVVKQLKLGITVVPEMFDCVTILFGDLYGFADYVQTASPMEVTKILNDVEVMFDTTLVDLDVYKVEAVGDTNMVASGVPERNGNNHIREICILSRRLLTQALARNISLRTGIHTGPCAAGVVGFRRPRYCLFGDTVNTASRMTTHGEQRRIHLSNSAAELLQNFPEFTTTERGVISIKGKYNMQTFWLNM
ncbi:Atrial natriuretic peptide receptor 1 [Hypsibius exemplaris]|uniref:guanylate cyclase n=1 Tax=Hypsibius exemplaris TaxID=2072580 RepID=A0A1W0X2Z5_HYPEX|nr:Atrial natriuretic peptide receptor 1 [Hypsibius exemplaris]